MNERSRTLLNCQKTERILQGNDGKDCEVLIKVK